MHVQSCFYPRWYVCTTRVYVLFCFVVVVVVGTDTLIRILHYCPISPCFQHIFAPLLQPCLAALRALARQPCARLPGSLARGCPSALRALARQPCARCCPDKSKQVQQNLRALLSRQVWTRSAEYYTILHNAFMSGFTVYSSQWTVADLLTATFCH
jgi:hypothetical protein